MNEINFYQILNSFLGSFAVWIVSITLLAVWSHSKKNFLPFIYKHFGKIIFNITRIILNIISSKYLRLLFIALLLILMNVNSSENGVIYSMLIFVLSLSLLHRPKSKNFFDPAPELSDNFDNPIKDRWTTKTGKPTIINNDGKPAPCVKLEKVENEATNSFIWLNQVKLRSGIIECDFKINKNGLFNIVFLVIEKMTIGLWLGMILVKNILMDLL